MEAEFWHQVWEEGTIGFHRNEVHNDLVDHFDAWAGGGGRVLVPLCGKSHDLPWLAERCGTVGVELSGLAVAQLHAEHGLAANVESDGAFKAWRTGRLTVLEGNVFDLTAGQLDDVDRVWDRAAIVALNPGQRIRYVAMLRTLLPAGTKILLNALSYDQRQMSPPPHSVTEVEVRHLYAGCDVEVLETTDVLSPKMRERGLQWMNRTLYQITL